MKEKFMLRALELAMIAKENGEVPVGCVIVKDDAVISTGYNTRESNKTALGHAEIMAIEGACAALSSWRLDRCTLFVTLEPCPMCMGAILNARIDKVVFGTPDLQYGCCGSVMNLAECGLGHRPKLQGGVLQQQCLNLLAQFFKEIRNR